LKESRKEAQRWWKQAQNDLGYAELGLREGYYAQACFQSHQVAEKALKALHYGLHEKRFVTGHSLARLSEGEGIDEEMHERLLVLDQYYITARYPNGLPDAAPFEVYTKRQAESAVETARAVLRWTQEVLEQL
jgi:HEPN domain-containing protein